MARLSLRTPAESEFVEQAFVVAPVLSYFHVKIEEHLAAEHLFEILPGFAADALNHLAALADHDRLLRVVVDQNRRVDTGEATVALRFGTVIVVRTLLSPS